LNREGETSYQSAQKIADMLIILQPPEEDEGDSKEMRMLLRKYRDGPSRKPVTMHWDLDIMDIYELDASASERFERKLGGKSRKLPEKPKTLKEIVAARRNGHGR
jgi:hypothetical protein